MLSKGPKAKEIEEFFESTRNFYSKSNIANSKDWQRNDPESETSE